MLELTGKAALITGASGGIGAAIAHRLYKQGASVVLSGTRAAVLADLADKIRHSSAPSSASLSDRQQVHVVCGDLSDRHAVDQLAAQAEALAGPLDILVNNAGLTRDTLAMRMKDEDWDTVLEVNLTSGYRLIRTVLRGMMKRRSGRIINMTSVVGTTGNPGQANYCASKAGLTGLTKSLAQEVASRGITVNCVAPGFIATAMTEALSDSQQSRIIENIPMARMGTGDDVAAAVAFLASDDAGYMTGQTLHVNGGLAMI